MATMIQVFEKDGITWVLPPQLVPTSTLPKPNVISTQSLPSTWQSTVVLDSVGTASTKSPVASPAGYFSISVADAVATITINIQVDPFSGDETTRGEIQSDFISFRQLLDPLEGTNLADGAGRLVWQKVAENIPVMLNLQTPQSAAAPVYEPLFFRYGLQAQQIDLLPGMRLRVDTAPNQFVPPAQSVINGFAPAGSSYITVSARTSDRRLTFDTFLSSVGPLDVDRGNPALISGAIDLQNTGQAYRHYRLFYPSIFQQSNTQTASIAANVTLAGAASLKDLQNAYPTPVSSVTYSSFRGRSIVVPEVQIWLNDTPTFVPIGTTVRQLLEAGTNWGLNDMSVANTPSVDQYSPQVLFVERYWGLGTRVIGSKDLIKRDFSPTPVQFMTSPGSDSNLFDLPVIQGDMIRWQVPTAGLEPQVSST